MYQYPLHYVTYTPAKFEVTTSNALDGETFARKYITWKIDGRTGVQTDRQWTDFGTKLIYIFFLKKAGIIINSYYLFFLIMTQSS